ERTATRIAESAGATADVHIDLGYPVTRNDPDLLTQMTPTLQRVAGEQLVIPGGQTTGAEDFSYYAQEVPGLFFFLGVAPDDPEMSFPNHSPRFYADERGLPVGVTAMTALALDFLEQGD
ncbi:MAG: M20/M25/M40 family metallo-hydrolase, partial [Pseudomonadota bacterium]